MLTNTRSTPSLALLRQEPPPVLTEDTEIDDGTTTTGCLWQLADDVPSDESPLAIAVLGEPPVFDAALPRWDGATHTALVASVEESPVKEPEWLVVDPWTLDAIREHEARCA